MTKTYKVGREVFELDDDEFQKYLFDVVYEFNNGTGLIHRFEAICDSNELQKDFIDELFKKVPNAVLLDIATCESINDFLLKREELARNGAVIFVVNPTKMFDKIDLPTLDAKMSRFYNHGINFLRDFLRSEDLTLKEIMFFF